MNKYILSIQRVVSTLIVDSIKHHCVAQNTSDIQVPIHVKTTFSCLFSINLLQMGGGIIHVVVMNKKCLYDILFLSSSVRQKELREKEGKRKQGQSKKENRSWGHVEVGRHTDPVFPLLSLPLQLTTAN